MTAGPALATDVHYSEASQRLSWLEQELHRVFGVDIRDVGTGTPLDSLSQHSHHVRDGEEDAPRGISEVTPSQTPCCPHASLPDEHRSVRLHEVDTDISLLALNATGEVRYMGASSGSFFAKYIANLARCFSSNTAELHDYPEGHGVHPSTTADRLTPVYSPEHWATSETYPFLLRCYMRWVHSIYPLFTTGYVTVLESLSRSNDDHQDNNDTTVIFYLVMSIGAVHAEQAHLLNDLQGDTGIQAYRNAFTQGLSAEALYRKAIDVLETGIQNLTPRISLVQILNLISIYASHRPSDNKQWHIGGIATRVSNGSLRCVYSVLTSLKSWRLSWDSTVTTITGNCQRMNWTCGVECSGPHMPSR